MKEAGPFAAGYPDAGRIAIFFGIHRLAAGKGTPESKVSWALAICICGLSRNRVTAWLFARFRHRRTACPAASAPAVCGLQ